MANRSPTWRARGECAVDVANGAGRVSPITNPPGPRTADHDRPTSPFVTQRTGQIDEHAAVTVPHRR
jgi:hypothetical protein